MKQKILPALFVALFVVVGTTLSNSQEVTHPSSVANNAGLPNAPSTTHSTTCTKRNGVPCTEWMHKLVGQYPPLPESPEANQRRDPATVRFWTYRNPQDPPLRNNKEVFRSKLFVASHVGGAVAMIMACRARNSGETWGSDVPAVAAIFGMDYLQFRFIGGPNAIGPPVYEMIHFGRASTR